MVLCSFGDYTWFAVVTGLLLRYPTYFRLNLNANKKALHSDLHPPNINNNVDQSKERKVEIASESVISFTPTNEARNDKYIHGHGDNLH